MPQKGQKSRHHHQISDVTIKEFADSKIGANRSRKGNVAVREKMFDLKAIAFGDGDDETQSKIPTSAKPTKPSDELSLDQQVYADYHVDIWFLISRHIQPEDVCRFALICRKTAAICASPVFWFSLYKRHYKHGNEDSIPVRLQPDCMVRFHKLRACVIRSLFFTYKPFVDRLSALAKQDFHNLKSFWIVANWTGNDKNQWLFYYKLRNKAVNEHKVSSKGFTSTQRDIFFNPERGCKLLVVATDSFSPLPDLRGSTSYVLNSISHTLNRNLRDYKLTLTFSNYEKQMVHSTVVYDPVSNVEVLDWWTPGYTKFFE